MFASGAGNTRLGIVLIVLSGIAAALMSAFAKLVSGDISPIEIGFFRQAFSLIPVGYLVIRQGGLPVLRTRRPFGHLFRGLIGNLAMVFFLLSVSELPLADATALSFASPLFITVLAMPLLGELVGRHRWGAVAVGFTGVVIMTHPNLSGAGGMSWLGGGAGLGACAGIVGAFLNALMMITIRQLNRTERPITIVFYFVTIGTIVFGAMLAWSWTLPSSRDWPGLVVIGVTGGLAQLLMTSAYRHAPAASLAPFGYVSILWSTLLGFVLWGQLPGPHVLAGAAIVIVSGLYILYCEIRKQSPVVIRPLPDAV